MSNHTEFSTWQAFLDAHLLTLDFLESVMDEDMGTYSPEADARIEEMRDDFRGLQRDAEGVSAYAWEMGAWEAPEAEAEDRIDALVADFPRLTGLTVTRTFRQAGPHAFHVLTAE